jgi:serine/threonine protein kinase/beta-lactam-binding protein with PASTA domain
VIGKKLAGRYEILGRVGGGGMAVVYKAKDLLLDRIVAVKVLRSQYAIDDDFVYRFRREAQAAASLSHPNIVSIYDVGVEDEETHYIIMEYVEGSTLKEHINQHAPLKVEEAIYIAKQIAEALDHAHYNQIIHRDIKPHNILIAKNLRIKVTDFGIARAVSSSTITHTGSVIGSVHYFSPEQARGGLTGEKSDIYSLGIVLYEMLTGKLPFSGDSPISVAIKHLQDSYTEPRELNPKIPQSVENIILCCLAKDPMHRYKTAKELISDVDTCLQENRLSENKLILDTGDDEEATKIVPIIREDMYETRVNNKVKLSPEEEEEEWGDEEEDRHKRSIWFKLGIASIILLLLGIGLFAGYQYVKNIFIVEDMVLEDVTRLPVEEAIVKLESLGLRVDASRKINSDTVEAGHVIRQDPVAGARVNKNNYVRLTISAGKEQEKMPDLKFLLEETARRLLGSTGFKEEQIEIIQEYHNEVQNGFILGQEPASDQFIIPDETKVTLIVSKGKEKFEMPDLIGLTEAEAEAVLERNNLIIEKREKDLSDYPAGQVYRQYPVNPGQQVEAGTPIRIWVSTGLKDTSKEKMEDFIVFLGAEETEASITIFVSDVDGSDRKVVSETLYETKSYKIKVKVSREKDGLIKVFKNGELYESKEVNYE